MGYATPANNINQSLGVINDQISNNQAKMDQTFADLRNMYADQIAQQQAFETAEEEKRALGSAKWDEKVAAAEAKLPGGFDEMVRQRVNDWGDEYYATIGDNSPEAVRRRRELEDDHCGLEFCINLWPPMHFFRTKLSTPLVFCS